MIVGSNSSNMMVEILAIIWRKEILLAAMYDGGPMLAIMAREIVSSNSRLMMVEMQAVIWWPEWLLAAIRLWRG